MEKHPLIRVIYLYLFTLVGLAVTVIGSVGMVNLGLRSFIFTKADEEERISYKQPTYPPVSVDRLKEASAEAGEPLTEEEAAVIRNWLADYEKWQEAESERDYVGARRSREASQNIAMILIGVPLYLYHWGIIKKDRKGKDDEKKPS
jgi:predicted  nucleic acid-binding Zn-ribbon protein